LEATLATEKEERVSAEAGWQVEREKLENARGTLEDDLAVQLNEALQEVATLRDGAMQQEEQRRQLGELRKQLAAAQAALEEVKGELVESRRLTAAAEDLLRLAQEELEVIRQEKTDVEEELRQLKELDVYKEIQRLKDECENFKAVAQQAKEKEKDVRRENALLRLKLDKATGEG